MTHPTVQKFLNGEMDAGGTISALEEEIEKLTLEVIKLGVQRSVDIRRIERLQYELDNPKKNTKKEAQTCSLKNS